MWNVTAIACAWSEYDVSLWEWSCCLMQDRIRHAAGYWSWTKRLTKQRACKIFSGTIKALWCPLLSRGLLFRLSRADKWWATIPFGRCKQHSIIKHLKCAPVLRQLMLQRRFIWLVNIAQFLVSSECFHLSVSFHRAPASSVSIVMRGVISVRCCFYIVATAVASRF